FCHVVNDKEGWNFASDEKQTKTTARKMIQMVMDINQKNFDNNASVSCTTCHRGSTRPVTMPTLPQTPPPLPPPPPTPPHPPPPDGVVARYTPPPRGISPFRLPRTPKGNRGGWGGATTPVEAAKRG